MTTVASSAWIPAGPLGTAAVWDWVVELAGLACSSERSHLLLPLAGEQRGDFGGFIFTMPARGMTRKTQRL